MNQCRIGEIHRPIMITSHQFLQLGHISIDNRRYRYRLVDDIFRGPGTPGTVAVRRQRMRLRRGVHLTPAFLADAANDCGQDCNEYFNE